MALIQCHECSAQISDHARTCPKCGAPVIATIKRRQKAALVDLGIRAVFAVIVIIIVSVMIRHMMHKTLDPLKAMQQQLQQQAATASKPVVVPVLSQPVQAAPPEPAWIRQVKLGGINGTPDQRLAIINGKTIEAGETVTVKITGKNVQIHCLEITEKSATISIEGINGPVTLTMK
jgi:predicted nucleic acid-binding Zn ribbon protein